MLFKDNKEKQSCALRLLRLSVAVTVTRSCVGVWDFMTGKLLYTLANTAMGAIVTHAVVNREGDHIVAGG